MIIYFPNTKNFIPKYTGVARVRRRVDTNPRSSSWIGIVKNDMCGKDKKFLSFISRKKGIEVAT